MNTRVSRRDFLKSATIASAALTFPHILKSQAGAASPAASPNNKLNIAVVGVGGRGWDVVQGLKSENFVAFCDVDDARATRTYEEFPNVRRFRDYREMLDNLGNQIDAVAIATPDHMHFPIAVAALQLGKHLFVEKPLTHTISEARHLDRLAREKKVATQMGNQGHALEGMRLIKEWLDAGIIGEVREMHSWTDRPIWPQGVDLPDHGKFIPVVPSTLDWNLWLGVAPERDYDPAYVPFAWRGFWDFGTGALGDMGCHIMDGAYWALELTQPTAVEAISARQTDQSPPTASVVTYEFPARKNLPALTWKWYDGGLMPLLPPELEATRQLQPNGTLIVGSKATVFADTYYASARIIPETKMRELAPNLPPKTIPRVEGGHFAEWIRACKGGPKPGSNFEYASQLTETVLLSNVAVRTRRRIEWDAKAMKVANLPDADRYVTKTYRAGFGV
jgi:Predicted dehydrogenases and related proteins